MRPQLFCCSMTWSPHQLISRADCPHLVWCLRFEVASQLHAVCMDMQRRCSMLSCHCSTSSPAMHFVGHSNWHSPQIMAHIRHALPLGCRWLIPEGTASAQPFDSSIVQRLQNFGTFSNTKKVLLLPSAVLHGICTTICMICEGTQIKDIRQVLRTVLFIPAAEKGLHTGVADFCMSSRPNDLHQSMMLLTHPTCASSHHTSQELQWNSRQACC